MNRVTLPCAMLAALFLCCCASQPAPQPRPQPDVKKPRPEAPTPTAMDAARDAFTEWKEREKESRAAMDGFSAKVRAAETEEEKKAARDEYFAISRDKGRKAERAKLAFRDAFLKTDFSAWDVAREAELLEEGLQEAGMKLLEREPRRAVEAFEMILARLPDCGSAGHVKSTWLPIALPAAGDLEAAIARCTALKAEVPEQRRPEMEMQIGDIHALRGDYGKAQECYASALAMIPEDKDLEKYDTRRYTRGYLKLRKTTIGKPAPEIDSKTWLGGQAAPLSSLKGSVVIVDFWATWCSPCIRGIPGMDEMHERFGAQGLKVLGVTMSYKNGFLPKDREQLQFNYKEGEPVECVDAEGKADEAANLELVKRFRERVAPKYPFVMATRAEFQAYGISGIPTVFVIDKNGRVGFVAIGSCREGLIRAAVVRMLKEQYAPGE